MNAEKLRKARDEIDTLHKTVEAQGNKFQDLEEELESLRSASNKKMKALRDDKDKLSTCIRDIVTEALAKHHTSGEILHSVVEFLYRCEYGRPSLRERLDDCTKARKELVTLANQYEFRPLYEKVSALPDSCSTHVDTVLYAYQIAHATASASQASLTLDALQEKVNERVQVVQDAISSEQHNHYRNIEVRKMMISDMDHIMEAQRRDQNNDTLFDGIITTPTLPESLASILKKAQQIPDFDLIPDSEQKWAGDGFVVYKRPDGYPVKRMRIKEIPAGDDGIPKGYQKTFEDAEQQAGDEMGGGSESE